MLSWSSSIGNKLFGPDPKLEFVNSPGQGAERLTGPEIPEDDPYWQQFLNLPTSPHDLPLLLPSPILLAALQRSPENLTTLIRFLTSTLSGYLSTPNFPRSEDDARFALNCVRGLARVVPVVMGPVGVDEYGRTVREELEESIFWARERVQRAQPTASRATAEQQGAAEDGEAGDGQFVLDDSDSDADADDASPSSPATAKPQEGKRDDEYEDLPPLAERLLSTLVDLLFVPGLTLPLALRQEGKGVCYSIWQPGIASPTPLPPVSPSTLAARREVLSLLTLLISLPSLLTPPALFPTLPNRFHASLVSGASAGKGDRNVVLCLLCSVVNTAFAPPPDEKKSLGGLAGEGLRERAQRLAQEAARAAALQEQREATEELKQTCLQFLGVVLTEHAPAASAGPATASASGEAGEGSAPSPFIPQTPSMKEKKDAKDPDNLFAFYLSRLHRASDLSFLLSGLVRHLSSSLALPPSSLLPGAPPAQRKSAEEALVVLWRLIEGNKKFAAFVARPDKDEGGRSRALEVLVAVTAVAGEWKGDETQLGLLRLSTFLLQTLTALLSSTSVSSLTSPAPPLTALLAEPLSEKLVGQELYAAVRRQCELQGVDWDEDDGERAVSAGEFVVITLHTLLLPSSSSSPSSPTARASLAPLHTPLLLTLSNLSPYLAHLGRGAGEADKRLVRIWLAFSGVAWVLGEEGRPRGVYYLLETFNNIINYNLSTNPHLLSSLLVTRRRLELLSTLTLSSALAEVRRLRATKRAKSAGGTGGLGAIPEDGAAPSSPSSLGAQASEKALGKRRERALSTSSLSSFADLSLSSSPNRSPLPSPARSPSLAAEPGRESLDLSRQPSEEGEEKFVGKIGFQPTEEWVNSWREGLPLQTLLNLLNTLSGALPTTSPTPSDLQPLLTSPSVLSLLPSPAPTPKARPFQPSEGSKTWLASLLYGRVYLASLPYLRDILPVQLFAVAAAPSSARRGVVRPRAAGALGGVQGVVEAVEDGFVKELESVGRRVGEVGGKVQGIVGGLFGGR
ncbi:hypothetical protein JCM10213_000911 [Rhodosporidiobolus nylandii]